MKMTLCISRIRIALVACFCFLSTQLLADTYEVSGPYPMQNLSFYLIHGPDRIPGQVYLTLGEAMQQKKVKVYETSHVNQLSIENLGQDESVYIQAGDIVKGGKQDRVFSTDMVLEPGSGKVDIASFCVEQGRWRQRGGESANEFHSSTKKLATKELRLAARLKKDQSEVWKEVENAQQQLGDKVGHDVKSKDSVSSLQLALENKQLSDRLNAYKQVLLPIPETKSHVIGYAFAINGKLNTADIYANENLFRKLWPKIVDAAATESIARLDASVDHASPGPVDVQDWIKQAEQGQKSIRQLKPGLTQETIESAKDVRFDTYSGDGANRKLYRQNYIRK